MAIFVVGLLEKKTKETHIDEEEDCFMPFHGILLWQRMTYQLYQFVLG